MGEGFFFGDTGLGDTGLGEGFFFGKTGLGVDFIELYFALETTLKLIIFNLVWIPTHFVWLYSGVKLNTLNLSNNTQRLINLFMAGCLLTVVALSIWSLLMLSPSTVN